MSERESRSPAPLASLWTPRRVLSGRPARASNVDKSGGRGPPTADRLNRSRIRSPYRKIVIDRPGSVGGGRGRRTSRNPMSKLYEELSERLIEFIAEQKIFFVGTATHDSRVNV